MFFRKDTYTKDNVRKFKSMMEAAGKFGDMGIQEPMSAVTKSELDGWGVSSLKGI